MAGRLELVRIELYGRVGWRYRLAAGLGIAKSTLCLHLDGKKRRDLDADMIERERTATVAGRRCASCVTRSPRRPARRSTAMQRSNNENVVSIRTGLPKPEPLDIREYKIQINEDVYGVRRAVDRETKAGLLTITDDEGRAVLVRGAQIPDEFVADLIEAWRVGRNRGRFEGRNSLRADLRALLKTEL
jgi:hypothetical protein